MAATDDIKKGNVSRRNIILGAASFGVATTLFNHSASASRLDPSDDTWNEIKADMFDDLAFKDGADLIAFDAPKRAHDAAIVPLNITIEDGHQIDKLTLVIDENPIPLAAIFSFGPASANASIKTRVRVNAYSYIRVIAHARDGSQYMVKKFVKATGGCAAPAGKDPQAALATMGQMRLRRFEKGNPREAQVMLRHPNHTGFQMDQISRLFVPADFVETINITQGDNLIMKVEGGISISEDPNLRFFYKEDLTQMIHVAAEDTEGRSFAKSWTPIDA